MAGHGFHAKSPRSIGYPVLGIRFFPWQVYGGASNVEGGKTVGVGDAAAQVE